MKTLNQSVAAPETEDLFETANLSPKRTGLPFVFWISPKGGAQHDVRIKISRGPKARSSEWVSVAIRPDVHVIAGAMNAGDLALLQQWVELNRDVIIQYWDGDIEYTRVVLAFLGLPSSSSNGSDWRIHRPPWVRGPDRSENRPSPQLVWQQRQDWGFTGSAGYSMLWPIGVMTENPW